MNDIDALAQKLWNYHQLNHDLQKADCVLVLGSHDTRTAEYGVSLFLEGWAPIIIFSGTGFGHKNDLLATAWEQAEADIFAKIAIQMGVPENRIIIENKSQNTGQNIKFTKSLLLEQGINPQRIILVQKPYMERRSYATFKMIWPEPEVIVTSPRISFARYSTGEIAKNTVINIMAGDLQRIKIYPERGFQIPQEIPTDVWEAYKKLVALGYTQHLIK